MAFSLNNLQNGILVIRLSGELGNFETKEVRQTIQQSIYQGTCHTIIWNLHDLHFMDSSGIGLILGRMRDLQLTSGQTKILCSSDTLKKIFQFAGLSTLLSDVSEQEMIQSLGGMAEWKTK